MYTITKTVSFRVSCEQSYSRQSLSEVLPMIKQHEKNLTLKAQFVVLLPCRTKLQLGSTVARQENNFDSDVVTEPNQIQDILMPCNNSPPNSPWERNLAKVH